MDEARKFFEELNALGKREGWWEELDLSKPEDQARLKALIQENNAN